MLDDQYSKCKMKNGHVDKWPWKVVLLKSMQLHWFIGKQELISNRDCWCFFFKLCVTVQTQYTTLTSNNYVDEAQQHMDVWTILGKTFSTSSKVLTQHKYFGYIQDRPTANLISAVIWDPMFWRAPPHATSTGSQSCCEHNCNLLQRGKVGQDRADPISPGAPMWRSKKPFWLLQQKMPWLISLFLMEARASTGSSAVLTGNSPRAFRKKSLWIH